MFPPLQEMHAKVLELLLKFCTGTYRKTVVGNLNQIGMSKCLNKLKNFEG